MPESFTNINPGVPFIAYLVVMGTVVLTFLVLIHCLGLAFTPSRKRERRRNRRQDLHPFADPD